MKALLVMVSVVSAVVLPWRACSWAAESARTAEWKRSDELQHKIEAVLSKADGTWGVSVRHLERHEIAGVNENERFAMASVFKVPILVELYHQVSQGKVGLNDRVEWTNPGIYFGSGILTSLQPGIKPTIRDLATLMIIVSDNAATDQILARVGKANVTAQMRALGLKKTVVDATTREHVLESFGLSDEKYKDFTPADVIQFDFNRHEDEVQRNQRQALRDCHNCSTPLEMSQLFELIAAGEAGNAGGTNEMLTILGKQQFNMRIPRHLPVGVRVAHKTGTITNPVWVVNDAGIITLPNDERVALTVFGHGRDLNLDERRLKKAMNDAEDTIAEIGRVVYEHYTKRGK